MRTCAQALDVYSCYAKWGSSQGILAPILDLACPLVNSKCEFHGLLENLLCKCNAR